MSDTLRELRALAAEAARLGTASGLLASEFDSPTEDADGNPNTAALLIQATIQFERAGALLKDAIYRQVERRAALAKAGAAGSGEG